MHKYPNEGHINIQKIMSIISIYCPLFRGLLTYLNVCYYRLCYIHNGYLYSLYIISHRFEGTVQHFKVLRDGNGKYFLWLVKFDSINSLVEHHKKNSVSKEQRIVLKDMEESRSGTGGGEYVSIYIHWHDIQDT